jgi:tRNA modification GTPase
VKQDQDQPHVVELTPQGRGAVATLLVTGRGARATVDAHLRTAGGKSLREYPPDRLVVARFGPADGEEVVVRCRGEDCVELHCHGGLAAVAMIRQTLVADGCRGVSWPEWAAGQEADPIAAAARAALAQARTERTAAILLDQYHGALRREMNALESASCADVATLLARVPLGLHLTQPWRVVLAGRPNVGKSSLLNALAGYQRAIVHPSPGTTRDVVTFSTAIDGWPVELCDTAGLHAATCAVERAGVARARETLADADLLLFVFDRSQPWSDADQKLLDAVEAKEKGTVPICRNGPKGASHKWGLSPFLPHAYLVIHNKCDLPPAAGSRPPGLSLSALRGDGIEALVQTISRRLVPDPPPPGAAVPFALEQVEHLQRLAAKRLG